MSVANAMKWTKKDLRVMQGMLATAWLLSRPLSGWAGETSEAEKTFRKHIDSAPGIRRAIVEVGIRATIARAAERYAADCECIGNALVRDIYGASTDEMVARFREAARDEDAARIAAEEMLQRVIAEGLPPEVQDFDPITNRMNDGSKP